MSANTICTELHNAEAHIKDPLASGTIVVNKSMAICNLTSAAAETRTLARPTVEGAVVSLHMITDAGDITLTVTGGYNEDGDTTFTFSDPGQFITLKSFITSGGVYFWRKISDYTLGNMDPADLVVLEAFSGLLATVDELNAAADNSTRVVNVTAATLSLTVASHASKIVTINAAAGCAITLPAATGTGAIFEIFIGTTVTSNTTTITRAGSDTMFGMIYQLADSGATLSAYECPGSTIITLDGSTKGGIKGDVFIIKDVASAVWSIIGHTSATGTEATPVT